VHSIVDSMAILDKAKVPEYLRAIEDPARINEKSNTVVEIGLQLENFERPSRVVICRWPQEEGGANAKWQWWPEDGGKPRAMNEAGREPDSCVVIYWGKVQMDQGEKRKLGFTYGLGHIAGEPAVSGKDETVSDAGIKLLARPAKLGQEFSATAYTEAADGKTVKLEVPAELELISTAEQKVKKGPVKGFEMTAWRLRAKKEGFFKVKATVAGGKTAAEVVNVLKRSIYD
jgi:hypothetical protein